MNGTRMKNLFFFMMMAALLMLCSTTAMAEISARYMYTFSNFNGKIPYTWGGMSADRENGEIYAIYQGGVSVFNDVGMEIFRFGDNLALGNIIDVSPDTDGRILVLSTSLDRSRISLLRCNYRGDLKETLELKGVPPEFSIQPQRLVSWNGYIYLADLSAKRKVVVLDSKGTFVDGYDIGTFLAQDEKPGDINEIAGFSVDRDGNILFTVPTLFLAYRMNRDHKIESFGGPGNLPGKFNIVGAIASDDKGLIYVADVLKSVVMVFDKNFNFQTQFGHRGKEPGNLTAPLHMAIIQDKLFVNQVSSTGVSVFLITSS
jgi:DNA-binding beta-propeller fold protein YncE